MVEERVMLQVLAEQKEYVGNYHPEQWVKRSEEALFEFDSPLAQVVIGVRRSGKSTLCHKVLLEHRVNYGYANFLTSSLRTPRNINLTIFLGKNAKNRAFLV
ncbi:MAG: hypothetical protein ACLUV4_04925 [Prevotella sp.]